MQAFTVRPPHEAMVTRATPRGDHHEYLRIEPAGACAWDMDPAQASTFASMREAARGAFRLPVTFRGFGMPLDVEVDVQSALH